MSPPQATSYGHKPGGHTGPPLQRTTYYELRTDGRCKPTSHIQPPTSCFCPYPRTRQPKVAEIRGPCCMSRLDVVAAGSPTTYHGPPTTSRFVRMSRRNLQSRVGDPVWTPAFAGVAKFCRERFLSYFCRECFCRELMNWLLRASRINFIIPINLVINLVTNPGHAPPTLDTPIV